MEGLSLKIEDIHGFQVDLLYMNDTVEGSKDIKPMVHVAKGMFDVWIMWAFRCLKIKGATP